MSKARVDWAFGETPVQSTKMDQVTTDWIRIGTPIWSILIHDEDPTGTVGVGNIKHAWYPYHPDKVVHNRLYLLGREVVDGTETTDELELSLDSGATWAQAFPSASAAPVEFFGPGGPNLTLFEIWDITVIPNFQWIGIRRGTGLPSGYATQYLLGLTGILYSSADTPF